MHTGQIYMFDITSIKASQVKALYRWEDKFFLSQFDSWKAGYEQAELTTDFTTDDIPQGGHVWVGIKGIFTDAESCLRASGSAQMLDVTVEK
jgi:hypothetical protein